MEYKFYASRWKAIRLILLASVFVIPSILMLVYGDNSDRWVEWMCVFFFGLGYPVGLYRLLDKRPQIIVNDVGIYDRTVLKEFINWELIHDAYLMQISRNKFICLIIKEGVDLGDKVNMKVARLNKSLGFQELNINLGMVEVDAESLGSFIIAMSRAEPNQRKNHLAQLGSGL